MKSDWFTLFKVIITVIIIVLIAPIVNADDTTSASYARAASMDPLPQLHFNNSQNKVAVYSDLGPGKNIQTTQIQDAFAL